MKAIKLTLLFLIISINTFSQKKENIINVNVDNIPFINFSQQVSQETGVRIFYLEKWIKNIRVTINKKSLSPLKAIQLALKKTNIKASLWNGDIVLLPKKNLISQLPSYRFKVIVPKKISHNSKKLTVSEKRYLTGRKADVIKTIIIGHKDGRLERGKATILGRILDEETGEPVSFATVFIQETKAGAVSNNNGFFTLLLKPGKYTAVFNVLGFKPQKLLINVLSSGKFTVNLVKKVIKIKEFVVHGDRQMRMQEKDPGIEKISIRSIKELPQLMGESDIIKVSETLPGIVSSEGNSGINVRGGGSDQNAFYIDQVPIYNTSHLFGFFSAFNSDIIKDFSIYKGYIPVQYGGRLSSVFNIITRQGNRKHFTAHGGISPITANLVVEGPIKKDTLSFLLSGRSTYSDWILKKIKDPVIKNSTASFQDFSGSLNYDIQKTQISLFVYHSKDHFKLYNTSDYNYSNNGASLVLNHNYSNTLRSEYSVIYSSYSFNTINQQELSSAYSHNYKLNHYEVKNTFTQVLSNKNTLVYGVDFTLYMLNRGIVSPYGMLSKRKEVNLGNEKGLSSAAFISDSYDITPRLNITGGLRINLFMPLGPKNVITYSPGLPLDTRYVNGEIHFNNNQPIKKYFEPDLRIAVNYKTDENGSVKLALNQMHQNLFMLKNTISVAPNSQWIIAGYHIKPSYSRQISAGVFRSLAKSGIEASVELYYKEEYNYPAFKDGASFLASPNIETAVLSGKVKAYGVEVLIKRSNRKLEGWLSYTYSRSLMTVNGGKPWNSINYGLEFPTSYDIPNMANLVLNYHLNRRVTFSTIMTYRSGRPITYPVSVYYVNGYPYLEYSKRNAYRIPDYFRTDISLAIEGNLKRKKFLHSSFLFSVYNITGRQNPYSVFFKTNSGRIESYQYSVIGVPVFTVSWIFKLGNYASD